MRLNISNREIVSISILGEILTTLDVNGRKKEYRISKIKALHCAGNQLVELPNLPKGLETLDCSENQLTSLPVLPEGLEIWIVLKTNWCRCRRYLKV